MKPLWKWTAAALLGAALGVTLVGTGWAAPLEITTSDNKVYVGEVAENAGTVVVKRLNPLYADKLLQLKKADIKSTKPFSLDAARAEFKKRKAAIGPENAAELVSLAEWALERNMSFDAEQILNEQAEKGNPEAKILLEVLNNLKDASKPDVTKPDATKGAVKREPTQPATLGAVAEPLSGNEKELERQIKLIHLREFVSGERVTIRVDRKSVPKVEKDDPYKPYVGFAAADDELLEYTRKMAAADPAFLDPLSFSAEPATIRDWTRLVQPVLKRNCATKTCHGAIGDGKAPAEDKVAKFQLLTVGDTKPAVALGNFEYFRRYSGGTLLRPSFPSESRILMFGLPKEVKKQIVGLPLEIEKHPPVRNWTDTARDYVILRDWIGKLRPVTFETDMPGDAPKPDSTSTTQPKPGM